MVTFLHHIPHASQYSVAAFAPRKATLITLVTSTTSVVFEQSTSVGVRGQATFGSRIGDAPRNATSIVLTTSRMLIFPRYDGHRDKGILLPFGGESWRVAASSTPVS